MLMYRKKLTLSGRNRVGILPSIAKVFHKFICITNDCEAMENNSQLRKSLQMCVKTLFVTVTTLTPNLLLNDCCFKIIVDTRKITESFHMTKVAFLHHFCR